MDENNDTLVEAIALSSPSGRMSKAAKERAQERIRQELFGDGLPRPKVKQPSRAETLRRRAAELRELASRGVKPRAYVKEAERLEAEAIKEEERGL